ncbi:hypothetical protein QJS04_geneDACA012355 [Acorus gramineus]|uniref:Pectinesterase inhibitor domain-containing protein n=1 Tax=Acorus gramineus TaxID=55184 RepID=A0AAV9B730_ACOGR|nr:hypothetical protein QJS04_geneDACA012355 [Acorus gramineus]
MRTSSTTHIYSYILFTIIITTASSAIRTSPRGGKKATDFIKNSCTQTTYPQLCFDTLSTHANTIRPEMLAQAALNVILDSARSSLAAVSGAGGGRLMSPREAAAISDCVESMGDSVDELRQSVAEMEGPVGQDFYVKVGDVQTWVSAALTEEDTCMDGLDEGGSISWW